MERKYFKASREGSEISVAMEGTRLNDGPTGAFVKALIDSGYHVEEIDKGEYTLRHVSNLVEEVEREVAPFERD